MSMSDDLNKKLESKIESKLRALLKRESLYDGFKKNKVINEVFDKPTVLTLYRMLKLQIISHVNGVVKAGKESVLLWAKSNDGDVALKVYLITTSNFKKRMLYISGDPRFARIKKGTRNLVYLWARKEYRNLLQCHKVGIPVPAPIHVSNNVLAMNFIGTDGSPAHTLLESEVNQDDYDSAINILTEMYRKARLVHGDFSEFNVFKTDDGLIVFDLGSAVDLNHPSSEHFLKRDINNITRFFSKRGLTVIDPTDVYKEITK